MFTHLSKTYQMVFNMLYIFEYNAEELSGQVIKKVHISERENIMELSKHILPSDISEKWDSLDESGRIDLFNDRVVPFLKTGYIDCPKWQQHLKEHAAARAAAIQ